MELAENDSLTIKMAELIKLEDKRQQAMHTLEARQQQVKRIFDKKATTIIFREGDLVLKWDVDRAKLGRNSKFNAMWSGPYVITSCKEANFF